MIVIEHPIESYSAGDWINFTINMQQKKVIFYKNGVPQYVANNEYFPQNELYFMVEVDDGEDMFYIEQGYDEQMSTLHQNNSL